MNGFSGCFFKDAARSLSRDEGMTFVELAVVMTIIAIIAATTIPSISQSLDKMAARDVAVELVRVVHTTRSQAILEGRSYALVIEDIGTSEGSGIIRVYQNQDTDNPESCTALFGNLGMPYYTYQVSYEQPTAAIYSSNTGGELLQYCIIPDGSVRDQEGNPIPATVEVSTARVGAGGSFTGMLRVVRIPFNGMASLYK